MVTQTKDNWIYKMRLTMEKDEEARDEWLSKYQCEWPDFDDINAAQPIQYD